MGYLKLGRTSARSAKAALALAGALTLCAAAAPCHASGVAPTPLLEAPDDAWLFIPRYDDLIAAYPIKAREKEVTGRVVLRCGVTAEGNLTGCKVERETPAGWGFGAASLKLTKHFRLRRAFAATMPTREIGVPLRWQVSTSIAQ